MARHEIGREHAGQTVEEFLIKTLGLGPRAAIKRALAAKSIRLNGKAAHRGDELMAGDALEILSDRLFSRDELVIHPNKELSLEVLAEADDLLVIDKPAGRNAHPLSPDERDTAMNAVVAHFPETAMLASAGENEKPLEGLLIHRLDRGTSGVLCVARNAFTWKRLRKAWSSRALEKIYLAWVAGKLETTGRVECFLSHDPKSAKRMVATSDEKKGTASWFASTSIAPLRAVATADGEFTLVIVRIHTGVTHQIRATCAALGHAVLRDPIYQDRKASPQAFRTLPLDDETVQVFRELAGDESLLAIGIPDPARLPAKGFFLHALRLRSSEHAILREGVMSPPPEHFG